jgi:hypothetical protein
MRERKHPASEIAKPSTNASREGDRMKAKKAEDEDRMVRTPGGNPP